MSSLSLKALVDGPVSQMNELELFTDDSDPSNDVSFDAQESVTSSEAESDNDSMAEDLSLTDLYDEILRDFDTALEENSGWAWDDVDVATRLHDVSTRLRHWKRSIVWVKKGRGDDSTLPELESNDEDAIFRGSLDLVLQDNPYLSGVVWSYLEEVHDGLMNIRESFGTPVEEAT